MYMYDYYHFYTKTTKKFNSHLWNVNLTEHLTGKTSFLFAKAKFEYDHPEIHLMRQRRELEIASAGILAPWSNSNLHIFEKRKTRYMCIQLYVHCTCTCTCKMWRKCTPLIALNIKTNKMCTNKIWRYMYLSNKIKLTTSI